MAQHPQAPWARAAGQGSNLKHSFFYSLLGNLVAPVAGLAIAPILAQGLGDEGRGALGGISSLLLVATALGAFGLPEALTYYAARRASKVSSLLRLVSWILLLSAALLALALYLLGPYLAADHGSWYQQLLLLTALALIPNLLILVPRALVAAQGFWQLQALEQGVFSLVRLLAFLLLWASGQLTVLSAVLVTLLSPLLGALVYLPVLLRIHRQKDLYASQEQSASELLGYGGKVWLGSLSGIVLSRIDQTLMIKLTSLQEQGLYAVAVTLGEIPSVISHAVRNVIFALDARDTASEEGAQQADRRLAQTARVTTILTFLVSLPIALTAHWWLGPVFGRDFEAALPLVWVLLAAAVVGSAGSVAGAGLSGRGRPGLRSWSMTVGAVFNLAVLLLLTPQIGAMGAALSTLVGNFLAGNLNLVFLRTHFKIPLRSFYGIHREDLQLLKKILTSLIKR